MVEVIPDIIETVEGRNVTIMCNVTANPKPGGIIWKKSDGILSSGRTFVREGNITILNITTQASATSVVIISSILTVFLARIHFLYTVT